MTASHNARHLLNDEPLTTADVAKLLQQTATVEGEFHPGVLRPHRAPLPKPQAASITDRFTNLDQDGKPTTGAHVAVYDAKTGLTWSAEPLQSGKELNHADAMKACADLQLLGQKDWRAPTIEELLSIVDYTRYDPAVDTDHFKGPYSWAWSSTIAKHPAGCAWGVLLDGGDSYRSGQGALSRVRAVRSGQ
jgi:hypothetical protein